MRNHIYDGQIYDGQEVGPCLRYVGRVTRDSIPRIAAALAPKYRRALWRWSHNRRSLRIPSAQRIAATLAFLLQESPKAQARCTRTGGLCIQWRNAEALLYVNARLQ